MRCPMCKDVFRESEAKPFCSDRCRRRDLGNWLGGEYRIIGERVDPATHVELGDRLPTAEELS